ncbi:hypothetical protein VTN77DRAFT_1971 [Rasamsonia byssochlamydoides]|uniref:uncharacterized protein n=1 Tax=Rasamsonia byssochlamydoides TaxID=89139 RepID=UPI003742805F
MGEECQIDSEYKRVNKRAKIEELEKQVQQLRSSVELARPAQLVSPRTTESASSSFSVPNSQPYCTSPLANQALGPSSPETPRLESRGVDELSLPPHLSELSFSSRRPTLPQASPIANLAASCGNSKSLDHITLSQKQIDTLFQIFFRHYHPYVPLLDPAIPPDEYYGRSPLLFWVIICISSRRYEDEPSLLVSMASPVRRLLWKTISNPPHSCNIVQAILLLCMWPFPTSSMWTDVTSMLATVVQTIAMRLGLH